MIEGNIVKVRFRKSYPEQTAWVFIGKVLKFTENWLALDGKGVIVNKGKVNPVNIDEDCRVVMVPRDNIAHIRVLPDSFDVNYIEVKIVGTRIYVAVVDGPDTSVSDL